MLGLQGNRQALHVALRLRANYNTMSRLSSKKGNRLRLLPFKSGALVTYHRLSKAAQNIFYAVERILRTFFGNLVSQQDGGYSANKRNLRENHTFMSTDGAHDSSARLVKKIDTSFRNHSQRRACMPCLSNMRDLGHGSSPVSMIVGPPQTGKSTPIKTLLYGLMYHSGTGHVYDDV